MWKHNRGVRAKVAWLFLCVAVTGALFAQSGTLAPLVLGSGQGGQSMYSMVTSNSYEQPTRRRRAPQRPTKSSTIPEAKPLLNNQPIAQGLRSGAYVASVGGVAFDQVAVPDSRLRIREFDLQYDRSEPDGERLQFVINGRRYTARDLPDWQLYPIAQFANSNHFAVVTLFGELLDGQRSLPDHYVVSFHPAFDGTLLGLRLFQADIMLLDQTVMGELPRYENRYVMHQSETAPIARLWQPAASTLTRLTASARFVSYVICDFSQQPEFSVSPARRELRVTGTPYFYFWRKGAPRVEMRRDSPNRVTRIQSFEVDHIASASQAVSEQPELLQQANPAVFNATTNTLRYSAMFRFCRKHDEAMWKTFLASLEKIPDKDVAAPTPVLYPKKPTR